MSLESPQDVVRKRLLELNIRPYGDLKRSVWDVTWRTLWGNPQDIIFQRPKDVVEDLLRLSVDDVPWCYIEDHTVDIFWVRPQDVLRT